ncbi:MAG: biotin-independent malonate decarboxylase subunit gamma [Burkholderiales bacterium]|nr:biotin-independent malonate decarboxylase subunit gamma [Burkholderiales bacterium]
MDWKKIVAELFPQGHQIVESAQMLTGTAQVDHQLCQVIGTTAHTAIGVEIALAQANAVLSALRTGAQYPLLLLVDTKGQRLRRRDEVLGINRYMAHLGKCLQLAREQGRKVVALVYDQALSGGFVSSGMMADACYALPGARIWVMDLPAMARITKMPEEQLAALAINNPVFASGPHHFEKMGAIEAIWYGELATKLRAAFTNIDQVDRRSESGVHRGGRLVAQKVINAILSIPESVFTIRNDACHAE